MLAAPGVGISAVGRRFTQPPVQALIDIDLELEPGSFTAVVGASGSGKSTLLRLIGGLDDPTTGKIQIGDRSPGSVRVAKEVGFMAQQPALLPWRSALDNVALAQSINPRPDRVLADPGELLEMVGLGEFATAFPTSLSGGMQQRVALARTLAIGAPLWLMDEPFAALDELTRDQLADDLLAIWADLRPTVVWVTHHLAEATKLADRIVLLTPRPGTVADIIDVELTRPRDETHEGFQDVVRSARTVLHTAGGLTLTEAVG